MFDNMDLLIAYINANMSNSLHVQYGTLSEYFTAVGALPAPEPADWPQFTVDYVPFEDNPWAGWWVRILDYKGDGAATLGPPPGAVSPNRRAGAAVPVTQTGHFTSRPHLKRAIRTLDAQLHAADALFVLSTPAQATVPLAERASTYDALDVARRASALLNHHDGITGPSPLCLRPSP